MYNKKYPKMKNLKLVFSILIIIHGFNTFAQTPSIEWQKCFGGSNYDNGYSIIQTSNNGYIAVGYTQSNDYDAINNHSLNVDAFIVKLSANDSTEWIRCYGGSNGDFYNSVIGTPDNCFLLSGITSSNNGDVTNNHGNTDGWIVKIDSSGEIIWQKCYGGSGVDVLSKIINTYDGGFICKGYSKSNDGDVVNPSLDKRGWVLKLDSLGNILWSKCYGDSIENYFHDIAQTNDGGYILSGKKILNGFNQGKIWIVKLNEIGEVDWQIEYGTIYDDIHSIKPLHDGSYIGVGTIVDTNSGFDYGYVIKLNNIGTLEWTQGLGDGFSGNVLNSIEVISDSCFVMGGTGINQFNCTDFWFIKMKNNGQIIWEQFYGDLHYEDLNSFQHTTDLGFVLIGSTSSEWPGYHGDYDLWIVKLSAEMGITETSQNINFQIYPNPAQDNLTVKVDPALLNQPFQIFSISGQLVLSGKLTSENSEIHLNSISEGVYLLQIGNQSKKIVKIK